MNEVLCRIHPGPDARTFASGITTPDGGDGREMVADFARAGLGRGVQRTLVDDDAVISVIEATLSRGLALRCDMLEDVLLVRANIESACSYTPSAQGAWRFGRPELTVSWLPRGTPVDIAIEGGKVHTAVTLLLRPRMLVERYGLRVEDLPEPLQQVLAGELKQAKRLFAMPLEPGIAALVEDLVRSRLTGPLRTLQMRARSMELMALLSAAWRERIGAGEEVAMRSRDAYLVAAARRILTQRLVDPPTLQELAHELGTNRNKLNQIFQRGLGVTPRPRWKSWLSLLRLVPSSCASCCSVGGSTRRCVRMRRAAATR